MGSDHTNKCKISNKQLTSVLSTTITLGSNFTWANNRSGHNFTKERLDRAMVNQGKLYLHVDLSYNVLPAIKLDHSPILINFSSRTISKQRRPYMFRYEAAWEVREECTKIVKDAWSRGFNAIQEKIKN